MKRRQAIKQLAIISAAAAVLPGCLTEPNRVAYENVALNKGQNQLLESFIQRLLPKEKSGVVTPEKTTDFILTVLNDCYSPEDIQKFKVGLSELQAYCQQTYKSNFEELDSSKQAAVFGYLTKSGGLSEPTQFFYDTARSLTIEHFTNAEFFMKNIMKWEFAPGYFKGCVPV